MSAAEASAARSVLVVGSTGFVGRHLVELLRARGHRVHELARRHPDPRSRWDVSRAPPPPASLAGVDTVVNLVGKKRGTRRDFRRAHVDAVGNLVAACAVAGTRHLVHLSVAGLDQLGDGPYPRTKRAGEQALRAGPVPFTVIRPDAIFGPGDDVVRNLARGLLLGPLFPMPAGGRATLAPVHVADVALAIAHAVEHPTPGGTFALHGPEVLPLRDLLGRVARALDLPAIPLPTPVPLARAAAGAMELLSRDPLLTRAQVGLLTRGIARDAAPPPPGWSGRGPSPDTLEPLAREAADRASQHLLGRGAFAFTRASPPPTGRLFALLAAVTLGMILALSTSAAKFAAIAGVELTGGLLALALAPLPWRELLRPRLRHLPAAVGVAAAMALAAAGLRALDTAADAPLALGAQTDAILSVLPTPRGRALAALPGVVLAEDLLWRGAVLLPLARLLGPLAGATLAAALFALAHAAAGPWLLAAAAFACGLAWNLLVLRTRSLIPALLAHLLFDLALLAAWA